MVKPEQRSFRLFASLRRLLARPTPGEKQTNDRTQSAGDVTPVLADDAPPKASESTASPTFPAEPPASSETTDTNDTTPAHHILAEQLVDMIARIGPDFRYRYVSAASERLFGRRPEALIGQYVFDYVHPDDLAAVMAFAQSPERRTVNRRGIVYRVVRPDGSTVWVETVARVIGDNEPEFAGEHVVVHRDVTERVALEKQLRDLANRDGLTDLANRRAFDVTLEREWERMLADRHPISLLLIDVDHFKSFNDAYGHQVGDDCLRAIARAIADSLERPSDFAARYGGEEIAVILPDVDSEGARLVADKARLAVQHLGIPHEGNASAAYTVTISVGAATTVAVPGGTVRMPAGLLIAADAALYRAKHGGRNQIACTVLLAPSDNGSGTSGGPGT